MSFGVCNIFHTSMIALKPHIFVLISLTRPVILHSELLKVRYLIDKAIGSY